MRLGSWLWPCAAGLTLLAAMEAVACDVQRRFVTVHFKGVSAEAFELAVLADLEAGLARNNLSVCSRESAVEVATESVAELVVEEPSPQLVTLSVRLRAGTVETRLDRKVDLSRVPADSHAFAVALAADELLRAGGVDWLGGGAEAVDMASAAAEPASAGPALLVDETAVSAAVWSLGLRPALERFAGGQTLWGADVGLLLPLGARSELQLTPGLRSGVQVSTQQGEIESSALSLAVHARYHVSDTFWRLTAGFGLHGARLEVRGASPRAGATASRLTGLALYGQGLLSASVPLGGSLRFELSGALGVPLRELEATAADRVATAASGLQLGIASALWLQL